MHTTAPDKPTVTLPNQPGRVYPNQRNTYTPPPRTLDPDSTPDLSWMPQEPEPTTEDTQLFSPCDELPKEMFARLGMEQDTPVLNNSPYITHCSLTVPVEDFTWALSLVVDVATDERLEQHGSILGDGTDSFIPGAKYVDLSPESVSNHACSLSVQTRRGRVYVDYQGRAPHDSTPESCPFARHYLEELFKQPEFQASLQRSN